jgi:hypothetical protein
LYRHRYEARHFGPLRVMLTAQGLQGWTATTLSQFVGVVFPGSKETFSPVDCRRSGEPDPGVPTAVCVSIDPPGLEASSLTARSSSRIAAIFLDSSGINLYEHMNTAIAVGC